MSSNASRWKFDHQTIVLGNNLFEISGNCVNCSLHLNQKSCAEKSFRICVAYVNPGGCFPPVFTYKLVLVNHGDSTPSREMTGSWDCSQQTGVTWDCILYADLVNPRKNWIHDEEFIEVSFAGNFVASKLV